MSIKLDVISKTEPGVLNGGNRKFYAIVKSQSSVTLRDLANQISQQSTVSVIDTVAVLEGLLQVIPEQLNQGKKVELGDLGSMRLSVSSTSSTKKEEVTSSNVIKSRIIFHPGSVIKTFLRQLTFHV